MKLFDSPGGATMGWIHYLAFDLFTGMWIARDAVQKGFSRAVQFPFLLLTLIRSEEHTSELQSLMRISYAVFCLKKKKTLIISDSYGRQSADKIQLLCGQY